MRKLSFEGGEIFINWTVVSYSKEQKKWECICECGNSGFVSVYALKCGKSASCGCKQKEKRIGKIVDSGFIPVKKKIYSNYKSAAKRRGHAFNITFEKFSEILIKDCHYCGCKPEMEYHYSRGKMQGWCKDFKYNGVDRVDNTRGYTVENTVPCCKICNNAKGTLGLEVWLNWVSRVYSFNKTSFAEVLERANIGL